ncbi:MAG: hypothetical protein GX326_03970, partial [Clostridiaceae bacterium]|nr:hypothetical protein [Clostridiaceae bacterium]
MKVVCINHQEFNSILDILRLYFQDISLKENSIKIEEPKTSNINCTIVSSQNMEVTKEQMRDQADQSQIFVQTFIEASDLKISNTVVPSALRRELKRQMYFILSSLLNISYPWGSLTGIRPTQIALRVYQAENCNFTLAKESLMKFWFVSEEKAKIALETAIAEDQILQNCNTKLPMLYIGIPFCSTRCSYCSFITQDAT